MEQPSAVSHERLKVHELQKPIHSLNFRPAPIHYFKPEHAKLPRYRRWVRGIPASKILVLHGDADPIASFDQVSAFRDEMRSAEANWELAIYSNARHSFTGEGILDQTNPEAGLHPPSEARSWRATLEFLGEVLSQMTTIAVKTTRVSLQPCTHWPQNARKQAAGWEEPTADRTSAGG